MLARGAFLDWPPNVIVIWSANFASSSWANASSQNLSDALSFVTSVSFGHCALTESAVVVSFADCVPFIEPKLLQKK